MKIATLEEISTIVSKGTTPTTLGHAFRSKGVPFLRAEDVVGTSVNPTKVAFHISEETNRMLLRSQLQPGDLLITIAGTLGRVGYVPKAAPSMNCNQAVAFIRLKPELVDLQYACYACQAKIGQLLTLQKIGTIGNLNLEQVRDFSIPLPPFDEQRRIATLLGNADRLRRTRRYAQQISDTFLTSLFLQTFGDPVNNPNGWKTVEVAEVFDVQLGKMLDAKRLTGKHSYPYLGNSNVQWGHLNLANLKQMDFKDDFEKFRLIKGDILVCEGGEVGRTAIWNGEIANCCYQKALHRLRPKNDEVAPLFFLHYMRVAVMNGHIAKHTSTATIAHFTAERFNELKMIVPPRNLQETFATVVRRIDRLRAQQHEADRQAEHLFHTLLYRAFADSD